MFKSILLATDGSEHSSIATKYALTLAIHYKAPLRALHVIDAKKLAGPIIHDVSVCLGVTPPPDFQETLMNTARQFGEALLDDVQARCKAESVECVPILRTGIVSEVICREAHGVDLVVLGERGEHSEWGTALFGSTFEATVRQINKPTFAVPCVRAKILKVLVAYDGSTYANRALAIATEACQREDLPMHILTVSSDEEQGQQVLEEAHRFLAPYKLRWTSELAQGVPGEVIVRCAEVFDADVIAMGAYGHSRLYEFIMGSTTDHVLHNAACPLLLYR